MSLSKIFLHKQNSATSGNKSLIGTFKFTKHPTRNVAVITVYGGHDFVNFAVNSYEKDYSASKYKVRREKDLIGYNISPRDYTTYQIERDVSYIGKVITLEFVPLDGALNYSLSDGLCRSPMRFSSINLVGIHSFPTHALINGYRTYWPSQTDVITNCSLESVYVDLPGEYTDLAHTFHTCNKLKYIPENFGSAIMEHGSLWGMVINSTEFMFSDCANLAQGSVNLNLKYMKGSSRYMFFNCQMITDAFVANLARVNVEDMSYMFMNCFQITELNANFNDNFQPPRLRNAESMFRGCVNYYGRRYNPRCDATAGIEINMNDMYNGCTKLDVNMSSFRPSTRSKADRAFKGCTTFSGKSSDGVRYTHAFKIGKGSTFEGVFQGCTAFDGDVTNLTNGEPVIGMNGNILDQLNTFFDCRQFTGVGLDTIDTTIGGVTVGGMFHATTKLGDVSLAGLGFDTTIKSTQNMFSSSGWTGKGIGEGTKNWNFPNVINSALMFSGATALGTGGFNKLPKFFQTVSNTETIYAYAMFRDASKLALADVTNIDFRRIRNTSLMFSGCIKLTTTDFSSMRPEALQSANSMFVNCTSMIGNGIDAYPWVFDGTSNVDATNIFLYCQSLTKAPKLDFSAAIITNIKLVAAFSNCRKIDMTNLNTRFKFKTDKSQIVDTSSMFSSSLSSNSPSSITAFKDVQVVSCSGMFNGWSKFNADVSEINCVPNAANGQIDISNMFANCVQYTGTGLRNMLANIHNSRADASLSITQFLNNCALVNLDLTGLPLRFHGNTAYAFAGCQNLLGTGFGTLNLAAVTSTSSLFAGCLKLNFRATASWKAPLCASADSMFNNCTEMEGYGMEELFKNAPTVVNNLSNFGNNANKWKQPLTGWCVSKITTAPNNFGSSGSFLAQVSNQPVWGTCPVVS